MRMTWAIYIQTPQPNGRLDEHNQAIRSDSDSELLIAPTGIALAASEWLHSIGFFLSIHMSIGYQQVRDRFILSYMPGWVAKTSKSHFPRRWRLQGGLDNLSEYRQNGGCGKPTAEPPCCVPFLHTSCREVTYV